MSATFAKITGGWGVKIPASELREYKSGDEVRVTTRRGTQRSVKLGVPGEPNKYGDVLWSIDEQPTCRWGQTRDGWCVKVPEKIKGKVKTGTVVTVHKSNGDTQQVTCGEFKGNWQGFDYYLPTRETTSMTGAENKGTPIEEPGAFKYGHDVFIVRPNRGDKTRLHARRVVEAPSDRLNEHGEGIPIDLVYERGAMAYLREEHRLDAETAKKLTVRYGRCIVCGTPMKRKESVERGIGPVCWKRVKHTA